MTGPELYDVMQRAVRERWFERAARDAPSEAQARAVLDVGGCYLVADAQGAIGAARSPTEVQAWTDVAVLWLPVVPSR